MSSQSKYISDENKRKIITAAVKLVNENAGNFVNKEDDKTKISKSSLRNLLSAADGLPEEFIVFSHYLAGKNNENKNLKKFIQSINEKINTLTKELKLDAQKGLVIKEFMAAIVMASRYCAASNQKIII